MQPSVRQAPSSFIRFLCVYAQLYRQDVVVVVYYGARRMLVSLGDRTPGSQWTVHDCDAGSTRPRSAPSKASMSIHLPQPPPPPPLSSFHTLQRSRAAVASSHPGQSRDVLRRIDPAVRGRYKLPANGRHSGVGWVCDGVPRPGRARAGPPGRGRASNTSALRGATMTQRADAAAGSRGTSET